MIALLDLRANPRLLRSCITAVTVKPRDMEKLPRVILPNRQDEPRIVSLSALYLRTVRGDFSEPTLTTFIRALQAHDPLTVFELWNLPAFLRFSLLEAMLAEAQPALRGQDATGPSQLPALFRSLRTVANTDWAGIIEPLIVFDATLNQDPAGTYAAMDFESREAYRTKVAYLARHSDCTEIQVAEHALDLAREGAQLTFNDPRMLRRFSHVGYYLVDKGFPQLASRVELSPPHRRPHARFDSRQCGRFLHHRHRTHHHLLHCRRALPSPAQLSRLRAVGNHVSAHAAADHAVRR